MLSSHDRAAEFKNEVIEECFNIDCVTACNNIVVEANKTDKEAIHSGQFMVSHFEAEEAMDDLVDSEVKMLDPEDPNLLKSNEKNSSMDIQLFMARKGQFENLKESLTTDIVTSSHLEIETSLTKLFNCMSLAYSQKLTSPKWNHFKGVRLRWKDKIRLNNVIWRCWHIQFILKRRTAVCQFASPLDVDIQSNPQSVVLEGKYWKRQLAVIQAEYRKWRRNYKSKSAMIFSCDSKKELDLFGWSSVSEANLILSDDWTSDTLFSVINVPFQFPDPREIARGAGIADFIQPSLESLQPNLDDIDVTFADLLKKYRLPPVPEEGSYETVKNGGCGFSSIMDSDDINYNMNTNTTTETQNDDANMVDLNNSLITGRIAEIEQQLLSREEVLDKPLDSSVVSCIPTNLTEFSRKTVSSRRISKNFQRFLSTIRREPHNYDKAQPTTHQTTIYQQMLAKQQNEHNSQQQILLHNKGLQQQSHSTFPEHIQTQYQPFQHTSSSTINSNALVRSNPIIMEMRNSNNTLRSSSSNVNTNIKQLTSKAILNSAQCNRSKKLLNVEVGPQSSNVSSMFSAKQRHDVVESETRACEEPSLASQISLYVKKQKSGKSASSTAYLKMGSSKTYENYLNDKVNVKARGHAQSLPLNLDCLNNIPKTSLLLSNSHQQLLPHQQEPQEFITKELLRSHSLPLNVPLHCINNEKFPAPSYQAIKEKSLSRSDLMQCNIAPKIKNVNGMLQGLQTMQPSRSDPLLNITLRQLHIADRKIPKEQICATNASEKLSKSLSDTKSKEDSTSISPMIYQISSLDNLKSTKLLKTFSLPMPVQSEVPNSPRSNRILSFPPMTYLRTSPELLPEHDASCLFVPPANIPRDSQKRVGHIHTEKKRRYNIKNGFDILQSLIPHIAPKSNIKLSKAAMLQKGAEHIKQLRTERNTLQKKIMEVSIERNALNTSLAHLHVTLPANGAPLSKQRSERIINLFEEYIKNCALNSWKFWILGLVLEPLLTSYTISVSSATMQEMRRTAFLWIDQHCSLIDLRPAVSNKLKYLSMKTEILSDPPSALHEEIVKAVNNTSGEHPNLFGL